MSKVAAGSRAVVWQGSVAALLVEGSLKAIRHATATLASSHPSHTRRVEPPIWPHPKSASEMSGWLLVCLKLLCCSIG